MDDRLLDDDKPMLQFNFVGDSNVMKLAMFNGMIKKNRNIHGN